MLGSVADPPGRFQAMGRRPARSAAVAPSPASNRPLQAPPGPQCRAPLAGRRAMQGYTGYSYGSTWQPPAFAPPQFAGQFQGLPQPYTMGAQFPQLHGGGRFQPHPLASMQAFTPAPYAPPRPMSPSPPPAPPPPKAPAPKADLYPDTPYHRHLATLTEHHDLIFNEDLPPFPLPERNTELYRVIGVRPPPPAPPCLPTYSPTGDS